MLALHLPNWWVHRYVDRSHCSIGTLITSALKQLAVPYVHPKLRQSHCLTTCSSTNISLGLQNCQIEYSANGESSVRPPAQTSTYLPICIPNCSPICSSIHPTIRAANHSSICPPFHPFQCEPNGWSLSSSINSALHSPICPSMHTSIYLPPCILNCPSKRSSIYPSICVENRPLRSSPFHSFLNEPNGWSSCLSVNPSLYLSILSFRCSSIYLSWCL